MVAGTASTGRGVPVAGAGEPVTGGDGATAMGKQAAAATAMVNTCARYLSAR
jgi:hypothetical protein